MNKKTVLTVFGFVMGIIFFSCLSFGGEAVLPGSPTNQSGLVCLNPAFDFGAVYPDAVVNHSYILTNQGTHAVKLLKLRTTCGCTTAIAATNVLAPGQATTVDVVINFKGRRGRQTKSIYVETDDLLNRSVRMNFTGVVVVPIDVQPEGIHFGTVGAEERLEREVLLTADSTNVFHVLSATSDFPRVTVTTEPREVGKQYLVKVVCDGPRKAGTFMTSVQVATDLPQMSVLSIPVAGLVAGDLVSTPANLILVPSSGNISNTVWVNLWSPSGKTFKVNRVELPGEGLTNSVATMTPGRTRLEFKTWGALNGLDGKAIRIETDLATMKEISIPIRVLTTREDKPAGK